MFRQYPPSPPSSPGTTPRRHPQGQWGKLAQSQKNGKSPHHRSAATLQRQSHRCIKIFGYRSQHALPQDAESEDPAPGSRRPIPALSIKQAVLREIFPAGHGPAPTDQNGRIGRCGLSSIRQRCLQCARASSQLWLLLRTESIGPYHSTSCRDRPHIRSDRHPSHYGIPSRNVYFSTHGRRCCMIPVWPCCGIPHMRPCL